MSRQGRLKPYVSYNMLSEKSPLGPKAAVFIDNQGLAGF